MWGFYAAGGLAVITAVVALLMAWASVKLSVADQSITINVTATGHGSASGAKGSSSGNVDGYPSIWGILIIVAAVIAAVGVGLVMWQKKAVMGWVVVGGSGLALIFAVLAGLMGHSKVKEFVGKLEPGTHYSLQMFGIGAWIGIVALLIGTVLAVLAQLSVNAGGAPASSSAGGAAQPWQQSGYGQPQYGQAGNAPAYNPQGQPQGGQQWGGQPAQGQQQWGNPQPPQQGQQQWGGQYDPAAHQPTQAVQPGFMPPQQPPQQPR